MLGSPPGPSGVPVQTRAILRCSSRRANAPAAIHTAPSISPAAPPARRDGSARDRTAWTDRGLDQTGRPNGCAAMPSTSRSRSRTLLSAFRPSLADDHLARGDEWPLSRALRACASIAHRDFNRSEPWPEEWLLIEWPKGEKEPTKYWLSTLPENIGFARLVDLPNCAGASSATIRS